MSVGYASQQGSGHAERAALFVANDSRAHWHDQALWWVRAKRDKAASALPEWEELRHKAAAIKAHTQAHLPELLELFEKNAQARGAVVHWARDAAEHNAIVHRILSERGVTRLVKSKSMLTEECHLNPYLEERGIEVVDTDLGERIVQLAKEPPSHIVLPAIHRTKEEIGELFHEKIGTDKGASDPKYLTESARIHLRERFMAAEAGLTGVNFAVAESGGVVVCTNEGNADMGTHLPPIHIASMGIEKLVPRLGDLGVFTRLLARSATGQLVTTYTSHFHGPREGAELHIVIVDNGRSGLRADEELRRALSCIRCGACMNTCPVYRRSGGYSYTYTVPGPIGSVLGPAYDPQKHASLPFASSLCGSCTDVCPVRIPLHDLLLAHRKRLAKLGHVKKGKQAAMKMLRMVLGSVFFYTQAGKAMRFMARVAPGMLNARAAPWTRQRELPPIPRESFREVYRREGKARHV